MGRIDTRNGIGKAAYYKTKEQLAAQNLCWHLSAARSLSLSEYVGLS